VALCAAIGKPDPYAGEVPIAYVTLKPGASASAAELVEHGRAHIAERAAVPREIHILKQMPITAVGKIHKPPLRIDAARRALVGAIGPLGLGAAVAKVEVMPDSKHGMLATIAIAGIPDTGRAGLEVQLKELLAPFVIRAEIVWTSGADQLHCQHTWAVLARATQPYADACRKPNSGRRGGVVECRADVRLQTRNQGRPRVVSALDALTLRGQPSLAMPKTLLRCSLCGQAAQKCTIGSLAVGRRLMSDWRTVVNAYTDMIEALRAGGDVSQPWRRFADAAAASHDNPPYHLRPLLRALQRLDLPQERVRLLEHGYGSGKSLLYLLTFGYRSVYGVDLGTDCAPLNRLLAEIHGMPGPHFFAYDGTRLPFANESFDFVFSQQVLEHVAPQVLEPYFAEEGRVLRSGGIAYHQIPHRLVPYESHTRTWLIHYAPRPVALQLYRLTKCNLAFVRDHLFLRRRGTYATLMRRHIGTCEDISAVRLTQDRIGHDYDGPASVRRALTGLFALPGAGRIFASAARHFMMAELVATKRPATAGGADASRSHAVESAADLTHGDGA